VSFLVDTDICSAQLRDHNKVSAKFRQHLGSIYVSAITLGELFSWTFRVNTPAKYRVGVESLLSDIAVLDVDTEVATQFGIIRSALLDLSKPAPPADLFIATTALVHGLTIVTHNVRHFGNVPGLRIVDWMSP
jgi:tRNA(fMet)-specific endonuclease VapC